MKSSVFFISLFFSGTLLFSQTTANDSVTIGSGYANQAWYSLSAGTQTTQPKTNWDLAFMASGIGSAIRVNHVAGVMIWLHPTADTAQWSSNTDTTGLSTWDALYNSSEKWELGAFGQPADTSNDFDLGWGTYNIATHQVIGDRIFIIKLQSGAFKKIWIQKLASGIYTFKYADLNGSNEVSASFDKNNFQNKLFGYYAFATSATLDREPNSADWDLLFTQYTALLPIPYGVSGVLFNPNVEAAQVYPVNNPSTYNNFSTANFSNNINTIGYDWKYYDFNQSAYAIEDSLVYFIKAQDGAIWKLIFTDFGGSSTGQFEFYRENISGVDVKTNPSTFAKLYPNPVVGGYTQIVFDNAAQQSIGSINVYNLSGQLVYSNKKSLTNGLNNILIPVNGFKAGQYIVRLIAGKKVITKQLIVQ